MGAPAASGLAEAAARRLLAIRDIGPWTVEMLALHGFGRHDVVPAGDLGFLKIVGRLTTGHPQARAEEAEVREFFAPYGEWKGLAGEYLATRWASGLVGVSPDRTRRDPAPRPAGTRWSARRAATGGRLSSPFSLHPAPVGVPLRAGPASRTAGPRPAGKNTGSVAFTTASWRPRSRPLEAFSSASTPAAGSFSSSAVAARGGLQEAADPRRAVLVEVLPAGDEDQLVVGRHAELVHLEDHGLLAAALQVDALVVPERAERGVDLLGDQRPA